ncbi:helix-turn-helix transcriptional regulator [Clostridium septicum]|uniref:helix-turn-helix transcriptional regulator n=1 Tax=Clostridium septicum TaxID=1504 RepID=UPI000836A078|nr:HTH domain-containing protein [Clostridium septicum]WLF68881.1 HTH domain-containing protein [Clostridium septicum]
MRLLEILIILLKHNKITTKELSEHFNVSIKTIQRDLDKLSVLGIPITTKRGAEGGVILDGKYKLSRGVLTYEDYDALIFSLKLAESVCENVSILEVLNKLLLIDSEEVKNEFEKINKYVHIDIVDNKIKLESKICKIINKALGYNNLLSINIKEKIYEVEPLAYVVKVEGMFLYAYMNKEYWLIPIAAIDDVNLLNVEFTPKLINYKENSKVKKLELNIE